MDIERPKQSLKQQYRYTLIGCALGDSLGMPVEGWKRRQIQKYVGRVTSLMDPFFVKDGQGNIVSEDEFGKLKYYTKDFKKGEYTDDTILTLAIAESIAEKKGFYIEDVAVKHLYEYRIRLQPDGYITGGFGSTTKKAFKRLQEGISPYESGVIGNPGNGPAMKMSPLGLYMHATQELNQGLIFAESVGKMTHLDPRSVVSGIVQAYAVYSLLGGISRQEFVQSVATISEWYEEKTPPDYPLFEKGDLTGRLGWILENSNAEDEKAFEVLKNSGLVFESYPFALFMFQKYWDNPVEGLIETVNWGGDCDTTGAIFGALAGAKNGNVFPRGWLNALKNKKRLVAAADGIYSLRKESNEN